MDLNNRELKVIQATLQLKKNVNTLNKTWEKLHKEHQLGIINKNEIRFTNNELDFIKTIYKKFVKVEPEVSYSLDKDRLDTANVVKNEKASEVGVFADQLVFAAVKAYLPLNQDDVFIGYRGFVATINHAEIQASKIKKLVVLENGTMLTRLHDWIDQLPFEWVDSLFLYRGHGNNNRHVMNLLANLPESAAVAYYGDLDPIGLNIAAGFYKLRSLSVLVPECWSMLTRNHIDNRDSVFFYQVQKSQDLELDDDLPSKLKEIYRHVYQNQLAVMQENVNRLGKLIAIA